MSYSHVVHNKQISRSASSARLGTMVAGMPPTVKAPMDFLHVVKPISTVEDRKAVVNAAIDYDIYYNDGGMDDQEELQLNPVDTGMPDYM